MVGLLRVMIPSARKKTCVLPDAHLRLLHDLALGSCGSALYLSLLLKMRILEVVPPVVALPMVVPPYFAKPVFGFEFDLGLTGSSFLDLFLLLV